MGGKKKNWTDGEGASTPEMQRAADSAAVADELALRAILRTMAGGKCVVPLLPDAYAFGVSASARGQSSRLVVLDTTVGKVRVKPAVYIANTAPTDGTAPDSNIIAHQREDLFSPYFAANISGVTRYDTVYAAVTWAVSETGTRKKKNNAGVVTTETMNLEKEPTVTIGIATGGAAPADGAGVYYFTLATVAIQNTFAGGATALADPPNVITQAWTRTGVRQNAIEGFRQADYGGVGTDITLEAMPANANGYGRSMRAINFPSASAIAGAPLDSTIDYRGRLIRVTIIQPKYTGANPAYTAPSATLIGGAQNQWDTGWFFYGDGTTGGPNPVIAHAAVGTFDDDTGAAGTLDTYLLGKADGSLAISWVNSFTTNGGFNALVIIEYTDPFWLPASVA